MKPYETALSRAQTLYRIPTAPTRNRVLELCVCREPLLLDYPWPGESKICCMLGAGAASGSNPALQYADFQKPLPYAAYDFDVMVLHQSLDDLIVAARQADVAFDPKQFLTSLLPHLAPGGLIAGCLSNRSSAKLAWRRLARRGEAAAAHFTLRGCRDLLLASGLSDVRVFTLLPNCAAPLKLVDIDPSVAKLVFRHELQARRPELRLPSYLIRRAAVELGLYPHLEESIFFFGYKPC